VTVVHRRDAFTATPASTARFRALLAAGKLQFVVGQPTGFEEAQGVLRALRVTGPDAQTHALPLDALLVFQGLSPKLGPIAHWGLELERKQLVVDTEKFSTSVPGIFAVGDINTYPGKKKLIVCGFHECVLAAFGAMPLIRPSEKVLLQYTTTSTKLHKILGVGPDLSQKS
jgi:thioredoxin reductase (NADPH)